MTRAFAIMLALTACEAGQHRGGRDAGTPPPPEEDAHVEVDAYFPPGNLHDGSTPNPFCADAAVQFIYVVDNANSLMRFDPRTDELAPVGTLACSPTPTTPFSMAIDRMATAWVLHDNGRIYAVSTADASCTTTRFAPDQAGFSLFGMGFVSDRADGMEETLFVAGGARADVGIGQAHFGRIDTASLVLTGFGDPLDGWPELTGTGSGELWGFFPGTDPPSVRKLDKTTGAADAVFPLTGLPSSIAEQAAWAFAFWGGRFYLFYRGFGDASTNIYRFDPRDGSLMEVVHDTGHLIVGAGVSTCAPYDLI